MEVEGHRLSDKLRIIVDEAAHALSIGRTRVYALIASGELPVVKLGRSTRVPADGLRAMVERLAPEQRSASASR